MTRLNKPTEHLAWLLGCLDSAVECLDWCGRDVDARIVEAHRAELAAGREWPGQPVTCPPQLEEGVVEIGSLRLKRPITVTETVY